MKQVLNDNICTNRCLVSIIVPIYNSEKTLKRCIDSILNQSYTNIELLLINDGSSDSSGRICKSYLDSRIKYYEIEHSGVSNARNVGLRNMTGKFLTFVDSDDYVHPEFIDTLLVDIITHEVDISCCGAVLSTSNAEKIEQMNIINNDAIIVSGDEALQACRLMNYKHGRFYTTIWNKMFRTENVEGLFFDESFAYGEDTKWLWPIIKKCNKVSLNTNVLYYKEMQTNERPYYNMVNVEKFYSWEIDYFKKCNCSDELVRESESTFRQTKAFFAMKEYANGNNTSREEILAGWEECRKATWRNKEVPILGRIKTAICFYMVKLKFNRKLVGFLYNLHD